MIITMKSGDPSVERKEMPLNQKSSFTGGSVTIASSPHLNGFRKKKEWPLEMMRHPFLEQCSTNDANKPSSGTITLGTCTPKVYLFLVTGSKTPSKPPVVLGVTSNGGHAVVSHCP